MILLLAKLFFTTFVNPRTNIANAGNTESFDKDMNEVKVKTITVDEGPAQKRFRARAQGRANRIKKRTSHLKIIIG